MTVRTLRAVNLSMRDRMEIGLLLSLLGEHDGTEWQLVDGTRADAAIIDADADSADDAMAEARDAAEVVITVSEAGGGADGLRLARPVRSDALLRVLTSVMERSSDGASDSSEVAYRLLRWPDTQLLRREWRLAKVCGALGRGVQTTTDLCARTGIDTAELQQLIDRLTETGCVDTTTASGRRSSGATPPPSSGLFGRIRARLGRA